MHTIRSNFQFQIFHIIQFLSTGHHKEGTKREQDNRKMKWYRAVVVLYNKCVCLRFIFINKLPALNDGSMHNNHILQNENIFLHDVFSNI